MFKVSSRLDPDDVISKVFPNQFKLSAETLSRSHPIYTTKTGARKVAAERLGPDFRSQRAEDGKPEGENVLQTTRKRKTITLTRYGKAKVKVAQINDLRTNLDRLERPLLAKSPRLSTLIENNHGFDPKPLNDIYPVVAWLSTASWPLRCYSR